MKRRIALFLILAVTAMFVLSYALPVAMQASRRTDEVKLSLNNATGKVGTSVQLKARLVDASTSLPVPGKQIEFGCVTSPAELPFLTDENGVATYSLELSEGTECGTYQVTSAFAGDGKYSAVWATATLIVVKGPSYLWTSDVMGKAGRPVALRARLTNGSDKPIVGASVKFRLAGRAVGTAPTDSHGYASFVVKTGAVPGDYTIGVGFIGDAGHEGSRAVGHLRVR